MADSNDVLEQQFLEMRGRALSLAADLDRVQRSAGGAGTLRDDVRMLKLRRAFEVLMAPGTEANPGEEGEMIFSDMKPPPKGKRAAPPRREDKEQGGEKNGRAS